MVLRKSFYIHWSAGRSPRVHEVNLGRDPSCGTSLQNRTCTGIGAEQVRYSLQNRTCTGTGQSCTGTGSDLFFCFDQHSYFSLLTLCE